MKQKNEERRHMKGYIRRYIYIILSLTGIFCFEYMLIMALRSIAFPAGATGQFAEDYGAYFGSHGFITGIFDWLTASVSNSVPAGIITGYGIMIAGFVVSGLIINRTQVAGFKFIAFLTVIVPIAAVIISFLPFGMFRILYELPAVIILYTTGVFGYAAKRTFLLSKVAIITGSSIIAVSMILIYYVETAKHLQMTSMVMGYIFLACSLIVKNQEHIGIKVGDRDREYGDTNIIRRYNLLLVSVFFVALIITFNLRPIIEFVFKYVGAAVRAGIIFFTDVIMKIVDFLYRLRLWQGEVQNNDDGIVGNMGLNKTKIGELVIIILGGAALIFILVKLLPVIYRNLKKLISKISEYLKRIFADPVTEQEYFTDTIEIITPEGKKKSKGIYRGEKLLRSKLRQLQHAGDTSEKIRLMYGIVMFMLNRRLENEGGDIAKSDTTGEILAKAAGYFAKTEQDGTPVKHMTDITMAYERVRYGDAGVKKDECEQLHGGYDAVRKELR